MIPSNHSSTRKTHESERKAAPVRRALLSFVPSSPLSSVSPASVVGESAVSHGRGSPVSAFPSRPVRKLLYILQLQRNGRCLPRERGDLHHDIASLHRLNVSLQHHIVSLQCYDVSLQYFNVNLQCLDVSLQCLNANMQYLDVNLQYLDVNLQHLNVCLQCFNVNLHCLNASWHRGDVNRHHDGSSPFSRLFSRR